MVGTKVDQNWGCYVYPASRGNVILLRVIHACRKMSAPVVLLEYRGGMSFAGFGLVMYDAYELNYSSCLVVSRRFPFQLHSELGTGGKQKGFPFEGNGACDILPGQCRSRWPGL